MCAVTWTVCVGVCYVVCFCMHGCVRACVRACVHVWFTGSVCQVWRAVLFEYDVHVPGPRAASHAVCDIEKSDLKTEPSTKTNVLDPSV